MNEIRVGKRIRINKSEDESRQFIEVGERGTILGISYDNYNIILELRLDSGEFITINSSDLRYDVYD